MPAHGPAVLAVVCVAQFFGVLNASAVGVVLPTIGEDLSVEPGLLGWLMTGFLLVYAVAIPFYGRLADLFGARRLFLLGVSLFSIGSLLAVFAPTFVVFALGLSFAVPSRVRQQAAERVPSVSEQPLALKWLADCSIPWTPECAGGAAAKAPGVS